jgi:hypothetical protein
MIHLLLGEKAGMREDVNKVRMMQQPAGALPLVV